MDNAKPTLLQGGDRPLESPPPHTKSRCRALLRPILRPALRCWIWTWTDYTVTPLVGRNVFVMLITSLPLVISTPVNTKTWNTYSEIICIWWLVRYKGIGMGNGLGGHCHYALTRCSRKLRWWWSRHRCRASCSFQLLL